MANKKSLVSGIINLLLLIATLFGTATRIFSIIEIEARQAGRSLTRILILFLIIGVLFTTTWLCLLSLLCIYFITTLHWTWSVSLIIILLINIILIFITNLIIKKASNNLKFNETREQFSAKNNT